MVPPTSEHERSSRRHRSDPLARIARIEVPSRRNATSLDPRTAGRFFLAARGALAVTAVAVVARVLADEALGAVAVITALVWLATRWSTIGPADVMARSVEEGRCSADVFATDSIIAGVMTGVPLALLSTLVTGPLLGVGPAMFAVALATVALTVSLHLCQVGRLEGRSMQVSLATTVTVAIGSGATLVHAIDHHLTAADVAVVWSGAVVASTALLMFALRDSFDVFDEESVRSLLRTTFAGGLAKALGTSVWLIGVVAVARDLGRAEAGRYSLALGAAHVFLLGARTFCEPTVAGGDARSIVDVLSLGTRRSVLALASAAAAAASVVAIAIVALTGVRDADVAIAAAALLPGAVALSARRPLTQYLRQHGDTPWLVPIDLGCATVVVLVEAFFLGRSSFVATAVVTSIGCIAMFIATVALFADRSDRTARSVVQPTAAEVRWLLGVDEAARQPAVK